MVPADQALREGRTTPVRGSPEWTSDRHGETRSATSRLAVLGLRSWCLGSIRWLGPLSRVVDEARRPALDASFQPFGVGGRGSRSPGMGGTVEASLRQLNAPTDGSASVERSR